MVGHFLKSRCPVMTLSHRLPASPGGCLRRRGPTCGSVPVGQGVSPSSLKAAPRSSPTLPFPPGRIAFGRRNDFDPVARQYRLISALYHSFSFVPCKTRATRAGFFVRQMFRGWLSRLAGRRSVRLSHPPQSFVYPLCRAMMASSKLQSRLTGPFE